MLHSLIRQDPPDETGTVKVKIFAVYADGTITYRRPFGDFQPWATCDPDSIGSFVDWLISLGYTLQSYTPTEGASPNPRKYRTRKPVPCDKCRGTGTYYWGAMVNGVMTHSGPCFRCEGQGTQTDGDQRRNYGYDNFAIRAAFRG